MARSLPELVDPALTSDRLFYAVCALHALPHIIYACIWLRPGYWMRFSRAVTGDSRNAVDLLAYPAGILKVVQFAVTFFWYLVAAPCLDFTTLPLWRWALAAALFAGGQALNMGIYSKIGKIGVYYGYKLGQKDKCPWVEGFPFNVCSNPQYVGAALTIWSSTALLYTPAHGVNGIWEMTLFWTLLYVVSAFVETKLGQEEEDN